MKPSEAILKGYEMVPNQITGRMHQYNPEDTDQIIGACALGLMFIGYTGYTEHDYTFWEGFEWGDYISPNILNSINLLNNIAKLNDDLRFTVPQIVEWLQEYGL